MRDLETSNFPLVRAQEGDWTTEEPLTLGHAVMRPADSPELLLFALSESTYQEWKPAACSCPRSILFPPWSALPSLPPGISGGSPNFYPLGASFPVLQTLTHAGHPSGLPQCLVQFRRHLMFLWLTIGLPDHLCLYHLSVTVPFTPLSAWDAVAPSRHLGPVYTKRRP